MKNIIYFFFAMSFAGCSSFPFLISGIEPKTSYKIEQVSFLSPNEPDWVLLENQIHSLILAKKLKDKSQSVLLSAMMYPVGKHKTSRDFLEFVVNERTRNDDKKRFKILSSTHEYVTFKELPCVKYQTLSEDHKDNGIASADFEYFKTKGYVCRYPLEYIGFQFEVSQRSQSKQIPDEFIKVGEEFFQNIQLIEPTVRRLKTIR